MELTIHYLLDSCLSEGRTRTALIDRRHTYYEVGSHGTEVAFMLPNQPSGVCLRRSQPGEEFDAAFDSSATPWLNRGQWQT